MNTYKVKSNIKHDGKSYVKGDKISLADEQAELLLKDGIIVNLKTDIEDEEEVVQPAVNEVSREKNETTGEATVKPGEEIKPDPEEDETPEVVKAQYKVLKGLEYPKGTVHKIDDVLELSDEEATKFGEGLIEKVENADDEL